ncbi:flagellar biosynthesis protein FlgA [Pseudaminobacter sp. 19-2017]|uniref:Flagellar biosynthesis protein FlgA n=1 Tax=Pseudaminobacter soli (ex Zhang et al. 2022) TaxID=2831468 RepID=A0A942I4D6_9HYPH|nr:flagellar biosynthesis protein FlgA [Pseudaminobacter soli]MBS3651753.1 flagellar biosynthesis protein FlgA [Pseudaminobacter soli]
MNYHSHFAGARRVETVVVGTGGFGRSFLVQAQHVPLLGARVAVDREAETAAAAFASVGVARRRIRICSTSAEAEAAWKAGDVIAAGDLSCVVGLPVDAVVEATGQPEAGAKHARIAIEAGRHVALVSKEVDSVVGPGLAAVARERGLVVTPVDGDQPSLLIGLASWAEVIGLEIIAAGKSSEYDFVFDPGTSTLSSNGRQVHLPDFAPVANLGDRDCREIAERRATIAAAFPQRAVPDLCELSLVANALDLDPDVPTLHAPIARIGEVPTFLNLKSQGGLLSGARRVDVFHCLRRPDEVSFAGGVFVVVRCKDRPTWTMLEEKGHVLARDGSAAMMFVPRHLLGLEAATSILEAAIHGVSSGGVEARHRVDLVARAEVDLPAGHDLAMGGHHHVITGVSSEIRPSQALAPDAPAPFYLAADRRLARPVAKGEHIVMADLEIESSSILLNLRREQDARFHGTEASLDRRTRSVEA